MNELHVTLINPPITAQERYGSVVKEGGGHQAPLGISYIAAVLRDNNYQVSIIDAEAEDLSYEAVIKRLDDSKTEIVGITSTTVAFHRALELANLIKKKKSGLLVVIGGPHVSCMPTHPMKYNCFDIAVFGEGEYTMLEIVKHYSSDKKYDLIDGLVFRERNGRKIKITKPRQMVTDLDSLPLPAIDLFPDFEKHYNPPPMNYMRKPVINILTSRGCPNNCAFCDKAVFGSKYRYHSAKRIIKEMKRAMKKFGAKEISIVDDTFGVNKARVFEFCRLLKKEGIKIPWNARISENTTTKEMLKAMRDAGCWYLEIGIESGSPRVLKDIRKGTTHERIKELVCYASKLGFKIKGFYMIGYATDDKESIEMTIKHAKSIPLTDIVTTIFTPFPGTYAEIQAKEHGRILYKRDWSKFNNWDIVYLPKGLTKKEMFAYWKRMYREFYFRPITIWRHAKQIRDITAVKRYMRGMKVVLKTLF